MDYETTQKLPILDISEEKLKHGSNSRLTLCNDIRLAMEEYGCFVAVNYDKLSLGFRNEVFEELKELFNLPQEIKMRNVNPKVGHGYMGKRSAFPLHEGMGIEDPTNIEACQNFTNLMWPGGNDRFCETAHSYANIVAELERLVMKLLFESYGIEKHYESHITSTSYLLRLLTYRNRTDLNTNVGFRGHTDKSFVTILHTNHVKGLEFSTKDGEWISFEPSPSSFVVLAGDVCMAWSNDRIKSSYHRVIVNGNEVRYTLGLFAFLSGKIQAPDELVDDEHPLQYKPFDNQELIQFFHSSDDPNKREGNIIKVFCGV